MSAPVVSVLMAVYNAEKWLPRALQSLLEEQTLRDIEVLAVDDASTDNSLAILNETALADPRLRVFRQMENQGQAVARNIALRHARGEFVCMLDADDWFSPDALDQAVGIFRHYPLTDCVVFRLMLYWDETGEEMSYTRSRKVRFSATRPWTGAEAFRLSLDWQLHGLYLVRRELHLRFPFDESYHLYSDDNTTHLHYLYSCEVRPCLGRYYWRQHAESSTTAISPQRFLHMKANLSMRDTLLKEGVSDEILALYDRYRWHNYLGQLWLFFSSRLKFDKETRLCLREDFRDIYATFHRRVPFELFLRSQWVRWKRRQLAEGKK